MPLIRRVIGIALPLAVTAVLLATGGSAFAQPAEGAQADSPPAANGTRSVSVVAWHEEASAGVDTALDHIAKSAWASEYESMSINDDGTVTLLGDRTPPASLLEMLRADFSGPVHYTRASVRTADFDAIVDAARRADPDGERLGTIWIAPDYSTIYGQVFDTPSAASDTAFLTRVAKALGTSISVSTVARPAIPRNSSDPCNPTSGDFVMCAPDETLSIQP